MKQVFLRRVEGASDLLLFFAGWGAEPGMFKYDELTDGSGTSDVMMCWDYRDLDFDAGVLEGYSTTRVLAWSMGVWVAGQVLSGLDMAPGYRVAVNGTPFPIHDSLGIPEAVFDGTLSRTLEEQREELDALGKAVRGNRPRPFAWTHAVAGLEDMIFPAANQKAAWAAAGVPVSVLDIPHWSKDILRKLIYLDNTWTNS